MKRQGFRRPVGMGRHVHRSRALAFVTTAALVITACSGGGSPGENAGEAGGQIPVAMIGLQPLEHGFAFANFPAVWYEEEFEASDLVAMFGDDPSVCVDGVTEPCELTAEAASFARMVNQTRAGGHCEGLAAVAQARFNAQAEPPTAELLDEGDTIRAILRAFATQFIPEVRGEIEKWLGTSLADKVQALVDSFDEGVARYSLGVYTEYGGHAVLPYAVEWRSPTEPRIMIYDSNWPGRNRYVDVDLTTETWSFSFAGEDPENDPDIWTGPAGFMDLTSIEARSGSCPFCDGAVTTTKNFLLVRSTDLDWSVEAEGQVVSPADPGDQGDGLVATPVKGSGVTTDGRRTFDYVIEVPINPAEETTSQLNLPGTASVFALTPTGIAQISTPGNADVPVEVGASSFTSRDPAVTLSLASGNLVASASGPSASLSVSEEGMKATVTTADGQSVEVDVTPDTPAAVLKVDTEAGGVQVLAQSSSGVVERREIAADGSVSVSIETTPLNLNATTWEAPPGLESAPMPSLPSPDERNLANPDYGTDEPYTPPVVEQTESSAPASSTPPVTPPSTSPPPTTPTTSPPTTTPPTTSPPATTLPRPPPTTTPPTTAPRATTPPTTAPRVTVPPTTTPRTTAPPPTTSPPTTTTPPTTAPPPPPPPPTTTLPPPVQPAVSVPDIPALELGEGPTLLIMVSNSPAAITVTSSDPAVVSIETVSSSSVRLLNHSVGTAVLTISQPATAGFTAISLTRQVTVGPRSQAPLAITSLLGGVGMGLDLATSGGSGGGAVTFALADDAPAECSLSGSVITRSVAGTCTVTATKAADAEHKIISSDPTSITFAEALSRALLYETTTPQRNGSGQIVYEPGFGTAPTDRARSLDALGWEVTRVHYRMEVEVEGTLRYVEVSFDPWTGVTADGLRVPDLETNRTFAVQQFVENMTVQSNMTPDQMTATESAKSTGVVTGSDRRGYLELWPWDYGTNAHGPGPAGSNNQRYDFNDSHTGGNAYGSFQVHDVTTLGSERTVFSWSRHREAPTADVGMGSSKVNNPDWTFAANEGHGLGSTNWRLQIFADMRLRSPQTSLVVSSLAGAVNHPLTLTTTGGSGAGAVTYELAMGAPAECALNGAVLTRSAAGTCSVIATKAGDSQYLAATSDPAAVTFWDQMHKEVGEGGTLEFTAPEGLRFAEVLFASYGTPTGSGPFTTSSCHAADSQSIVSGIAVGTTTFTVRALNDVFGDPCGGTVKKLAVSMRLEPNWASVQGTGGTVTDVEIDGVSYRLHSFTTVGAHTFSVTDAGTSGEIEYLVVGGGGAGGRSGSAGAGGGGGGGQVTTGALVVAVGDLGLTVGAGGPGLDAGSHVTGAIGGSSTLGAITALGGGGGGGANNVAATSGSSGGGGGATSAIGMTGAAGTAFGFAGGDALAGAAGGGGGAGAVGGHALDVDAQRNGGAGGAGVSSDITGAVVHYGGGGGGGRQGTGAGGVGGVGGGGAGGAQDSSGVDGVPNTGGGGGGIGGHPGGGTSGAGGSGIVIIRYRLSPPTP